MWTRAALAFALACAAGGCASKGPDQAPAGRASSDALENEPYVTAEPLHPHHTAGEWAVAVVGTPFYWVFKSAVCVGSVAVAAPTSAVVALGGYHAREEGLEILGEGVAQNCGPPWVLSP
jgi:hypothetical protein